MARDFANAISLSLLLHYLKLRRLTLCRVSFLLFFDSIGRSLWGWIVGSKIRGRDPLRIWESYTLVFSFWIRGNFLYLSLILKRRSLNWLSWSKIAWWSLLNDLVSILHCLWIWDSGNTSIFIFLIICTHGKPMILKKWPLHSDE